MAKYSYMKNLNDDKFKLLTGVKKDTFELMLSKLKEAQRNKRQTGFITQNKLTIPDKLIITLGYLRENRTMEHIGADYGVSKSTICKTIYWVENILSKCEEFKLPSKRKILESNMEYEVFVVDATETPIERPLSKSKSKKKEKKKQ